MAGIETKSIAFMIDELCTTSQKCWWAQEDLMNKSLTENERLSAAERAQSLNNRRNQLIRAIDERLGETNISVTSKTYA